MGKSATWIKKPEPNTLTEMIELAIMEDEAKSRNRAAHSVAIEMEMKCRSSMIPKNMKKWVASGIKPDMK
jgi:hypothetical protein